MNRRAILVPAAAFLLAAAASPVRAQDDAGCVTKDCHAVIGTKKWMHGPVGAYICSICHNRVEGKDHEFVMAAEREELCFNCHETTRDMMLENHLHTPVADGNCVGCHDPHQTDYRFSLKGEAAELCFVCHNRAEFEKEFVHGPIGVGDCNACHNPHASAHPNQLVAAPDDLCFNCHREQRDLLERRHIHPPVAEKCTSCHAAHASVAKFLLPSDPPQLCYGCHANIAEYANVSNRHEPVANGQCDKCHEPHASDNPKLFPVAQTDLCFSCHTELQEYVSQQTFLHGPVQQGDCNACHDPHGSNYHRILIQYFPPEFYTPYAEEKYSLCFECHNRQIALDERTTTLTDFRDQDRNLHFLHVNKQEKGRSCRACHEAHASTQGKHIRKSVPFGKISWELPVNFTPKDSGGSCVVGCHAPFDYSPNPSGGSSRQ